MNEVKIRKEITEIKNTMETENMNNEVNEKYTFKDFVLYFIAPMIIMIFILNVVIIPSSVSGRSMNPTLNNHDLVIINKLVYRIKPIERFDIVELLQSVVAANDLRANQKGINLSFISEDDKLYVWADEYKTEEVITNYLSNAINHCDFDKEIKVYYKKLGDVIRVYVFNTGKHIPEEDIDNIWVKFYKVDKARTREYGGNGIGLSIVKAIMDAYGKECGVNNVDGGVEFWFDLDAKA